MSSKDSRCNVHQADVDGHEEPFNYCSIHHLDYYVDYKPADRPTWEKFTDECIRSMALKAQELRKQAKELVRQLSLVQDRVDGLSICLPGIINDTAFPYFEKEVNLVEIYHKVLRSLGYNNRTLATKVDELHMRIDVHQDSYMDLRDALVCHSGLTAYGAQEHIKRRVVALGLATGHTHEHTACSPPPSSSPISTPPRVSPSTSPLSQSQKTPSKTDSKPVNDANEPLFSSSARDHLQAFLRRARANRQQRAAETTEDSPASQDSPAATSMTPQPRELGARPRDNISIQPLSLHRSLSARPLPLSPPPSILFPLQTSAGHKSCSPTLSFPSIFHPKSLMHRYQPPTYGLPFHQAIPHHLLMKSDASRWKDSHGRITKSSSLASIWSRRTKAGNNPIHYSPIIHHSLITNHIIITC
jgi:hypothetical protein